MATMKRVTMLFPEDLWNDMAIAAAIRAQTRSEFTRESMRRAADISLKLANMKGAQSDDSSMDESVSP